MNDESSIKGLREKTPEEKIQSAKIDLMDEYPFYAYLAEYVNIIEVNPEHSDVPTAAVDFRGNMYYNPEWIGDLVKSEVQGVIAHELLHIVLEGKKRRRGRKSRKWNVAQDIIINHIVTKDGMELPDVPYIPDSNGELHIDGHVHIDDITEETFESVYEKIESPELEIFADGHIYDPDSDAADIEEIPEEMKEIDWEEATVKASHHARQKGEEPLGAGERVSKGEAGDIDYTELIQKTLSSLVPRNFTYRTPHKTSHTLKYYRPNIEYDSSVNVAVALDTSGSITDKNLEDFLAEIAKIVSQYRIIDLTVIQHDAEVHDVSEYSNPNEQEFETIDVKGRGGTDHVPVFEEIEDMNESFDALISLTDGYTRIPEEHPGYPVIWVLNNFNVDESNLHFGEITRTHMGDE